MKIGKSTLIFVIFVLMLSIFVANVANLINVDSHALAHDNVVVSSESDFEKHDQSQHRPKKYSIGDSTDYLIWFLQISDIHISIFRDLTRVSELEEFCQETIDAIKPPIVLASGDLTDAKTIDKMGSRQHLQEWQLYKQVLQDSNITSRTLWLDVRGNHDNFNVLHLYSSTNYYANYSIQGRKNPRSYMQEMEHGSEKFAFIAVDACLNPGPRRPFNFVGFLDDNETDKIRNLAEQSRKDKVDHIIWFGHYPTSCILSHADGGVRGILGKYHESMVYLCGHYHTLAGAVPNMYTLQQAGFLELELADWKDNRMYRLAAVDHGLFSFIDLKHQEWPVALITNPKHALFSMPRKENLQSIIDSTHIRILAFSTVPVETVEVQVDHEPWRKCLRINGGPLYVVPWNTTKYQTGIHNIQAKVVDAENREKVIVQQFSLDGTRLSFQVLSRLILMSNASHIFQFLFGTVLLLLVIPLCLLRFFHVLCEAKRMRRPRLRVRFFHWWVRKLWILSTVDRLFFPLVFYALYLTVGPWAVGEVIEGEIGVIFAWGTFVGNSYLPGAFTYVYGFFQLFSFHLPLTLILAHHVDKKLQSIEKPPKKSPLMVLQFCRHIPILLLIGMEVTMAYFFWLAYGTMATALCPLRTWSIFLALFLWYQTQTMPLRCLRSAANVWCSSRIFDGNQSAGSQRTNDLE